MKLVDAEARRLKVPMPDLEGRDFGAGDDAMHAVPYFDSLGQMCNLRTQSEPLKSGWTSDGTGAHSEHMITKYWNAQIRHMCYAKRLAEKDKPPMMNQGSH